MTTEYGPNSHKAKAANEKKAKKEIKPVIEAGAAVERKKGLGRKIKELFFTGSFKDAATAMLQNVALPAVKNTMSDGAKNVVDKMIYGENAPRRPGYGNAGRVSYGGYSRSAHPMHRGTPPDQPPRGRERDKSDGNEIVLNSRRDAETVLESLRLVVEEYEVASLADLYDLMGMPSSAVDNNWGWTSLSGSSIRQIRDGFLLELPIVESL